MLYYLSLIAIIGLSIFNIFYATKKFDNKKLFYFNIVLFASFVLCAMIAYVDPRNSNTYNFIIVCSFFCILISQIFSKLFSDYNDNKSFDKLRLLFSSVSNIFICISTVIYACYYITKNNIDCIPMYLCVLLSLLASCAVAFYMIYISPNLKLDISNHRYHYFFECLTICTLVFLSIILIICKVYIISIILIYSVFNIIHKIFEYYQLKYPVNMTFKTYSFTIYILSLIYLLTSIYVLI